MRISSIDNSATSLPSNSTSREALQKITVGSPSCSEMSLSTTRVDNPIKRRLPVHKDTFSSVPRRNPWIGRRLTSGSRPRRFSCRCGASFGKKEHLRRHDEVVHRGIRPYKCDVCDLLFGTKQNMQVHSRTRKHASRAAERERRGREQDAIEGVLALAGHDSRPR